ncbi:MAG: SIS domain-containing protein [Acetobacteraceae bacterium]|nr:SIS domain-containing protein [Acetobacteraceae bacterium]
MDEAARFERIMIRSAELQREAGTRLARPVLDVVGVCERSLRAGGKLFFCGNGGSAADSQHLATELLIRLRGAVERESWPAVALTLDPSALTACGNDYGFEHIFERPLRGLGRAGDVLFGLSTSGRSANVVRALAVARDIGMATVGMLGGDGEPAIRHCDHVLLVPDHETARVQECHLALGHAILELLEDRLVADRRGRMTDEGPIGPGAGA